jgi:hypothetical protein
VTTRAFSQCLSSFLAAHSKSKSPNIKEILRRDNGDRPTPRIGVVGGVGIDRLPCPRSPLQWPWPRGFHEFLIEVFLEHLSDKGREKNRIKLYPPFPAFRSDVSLRSFQPPSTLSCGHAGMSDCHGNSMDGDVDGYITITRAYSTLHLSNRLPHVAATYKSRVWIWGVVLGNVCG